MGNANAAVFFDRDGVLIATHVRNNKPYAINSIADLVILPNALAIINQFRKLNYKIVVVTNQPDVGNGFTAKQIVDDINLKLSAQLPIDLIKVCYHRQQDDCYCRKPRIGMFKEAADQLNIDLTRSIMIGDRNSDICAGKDAGCFTIFIDYGYNEPIIAKPDLIVRSLTEIMDYALHKS